jgi:hypothetical protein
MQRRFVAWVCLTLLSISPLGASERKALEAVSTDALSSEGQRVVSDADSLHFIWWIPVEFWEATFAQDASVPEADADEILRVLRPYSMLAVVQADISSLGAFRFFDRDRVANGLSIAYAAGGGAKPNRLMPLTDVDPDLEVIIGVLRPVLAAAMGNMGENFHFFVLSDDQGGKRVASPYEFGEMQVSLADGSTSGVRTSIELPLDALFVPRQCPNGRPAHVTWSFCPWGGERLAD